MKNKNFRSIGYCEDCGKQLYKTRGAAKAVCRLFPGEHKTPYNCPVMEQYFHVGGLSRDVIAGTYSRDDIYGQAS
jgi:hypothetical protein